MKVLLIHPSIHSSEGRLVPPLGLAYLTSVLRRHNHKVKILDMRLPSFKGLEMVKQHVLSFGPDLIGISSTTFGFKRTLGVIKKAISTQPNVPIVIGGPHASIMRDKLLRDIYELSFVVYGEGEFTLLELCNALVSGSDFYNIQGLIWRKDNEIVTNSPRPLNDDLDSLPFASESYDLLGFDKYYDSSQSFIITSRGCPYRCIYCSVPEIWGSKFRARSPKNVVDEIELLYLRYKTRNFHLMDDNFSFDLARAKKICDEILERKLDISWDTPNGIRADRIDRELLCKMKTSGCQYVRFGLESANQTIVDRLNKHLKVDEVKKAIECSKDCGLEVGVFFVVGSPGENFNTVKRSVEFALSMDVEPIFSMLTPYPRTKLWDWVSMNARWTQDPYEYLYSHGHIDQASVPYETDDFTRKERVKAWKYIERAVIAKKWQRYYEIQLKLLFPNFRNNTALETISIILSLLRSFPFLNVALRSKTMLMLKRLIVFKINDLKNALLD